MKRILVPMAVAVTTLWAAAAVVWVRAWPEVAGKNPAPAPTVLRYGQPTVEFGPGVDLDRAAVSAQIERIVNDPRGWRTDLTGYTVRFVVPGTEGTKRMPGTIGLAGLGHNRVVISAEAWTTLGPRFAAIGGTLDDQRTWVLLHEIGHVLANSGDHEECPGPGLPAPIMRGVNYEVGECSLNVWPHPAGL